MNPDWRVRGCACRALECYGLNGRKDEVVAAMIPVLHNPDQFIRELVIESFLRLRPMRESAVQAVADISIRDGSAHVRQGAELLLSQAADLAKHNRGE